MKILKSIRKAKKVTLKHIYPDAIIPIFKDPKKFDQVTGMVRLIKKVTEPIVFDLDDTVASEHEETHYIGQKVIYNGTTCYITNVYPTAIVMTGQFNGIHKAVKLEKPFPPTLIDGNKASKYIIPEVDKYTIYKWLWDLRNSSYFVKFSDYENNELNLKSKAEKKEFFKINPHLILKMVKPFEKRLVRLNPRGLYFLSEKWDVEYFGEPFLGDLIQYSEIALIPKKYSVEKIDEIYTGIVDKVDEYGIHLKLKNSIFGKNFKKKDYILPLDQKNRLYLLHKPIHKGIYTITYYDWYNNHKILRERDLEAN